MYCRLLTLLLAFSSFLSLQAQQVFTDKITISANGDTRNAAIYLPETYSKAHAYPLVIYTHGLSQAGTDVNKLFLTGLPKLLKDRYQPSFEFIMVAPQSATYSIDPRWLEGILSDA